MLKWAVNGTRQSYWQNDDLINSSFQELRSTSRSSLKSLNQNSADLIPIRAKISWQDKENRCTSTPLQPRARTFTDNSMRKLDSFKDLSNIMISPNKRPSSRNAKEPFKSPLKPCQNTTLPNLEEDSTSKALRPRRPKTFKAMGLLDISLKKSRYLAKFNILITGGRL